MGKRKIKILAIFGTRTEVIKLYPVLEKLKLNKAFEVITVSTSQYREELDELLSLLGMTPDHDLDLKRDKHFMADITALALSGLDPLLKLEKPDLVLVQGETTSAFSGALAAYYNKIPVGHIEAGIRAINKMHPHPEAVNRRLISSICDLHFAPGDQNAEILISEGNDPKDIYVTGNTIVDAVLKMANNTHDGLNQFIPADSWESYRTIFASSSNADYWGKPLKNLCLALIDLTQAYPDIQIVYQVHSNPDACKTVFKILFNRERIHLLDSASHQTIVSAMGKSYLIITDSDRIQEEGLALQKPVLFFKEKLQRPETLISVGIKLIGLKRKTIVVETSGLLEDQQAYRSMVPDRNPYGDGHTADRIVQAIQSYFGLASRPKDYKPEASKQKTTQTMVQSVSTTALRSTQVGKASGIRR